MARDIVLESTAAKIKVICNTGVVVHLVTHWRGQAFAVTVIQPRHNPLSSRRRGHPPDR